MRHRRSFLAVVLAVATGGLVPGLTAAAVPSDARGAAAETDPFPNAGDAYLVALDGRVLWARAPDARRAPASLTKLLAALVALESRWDPDAWVVASRRAVSQAGARAGLRAGEALTARDALTATLVASANDACVALSEHVAGSVEAFVGRMNARAAALGLAHTHVASPCGLDAPGHLSSARDLWHVTVAALERPEIRRLVALRETTVRTRGGRSLALRNPNALLGRLDGAEGVKTGFTHRAGRCLIALVRRGSHEVVLVLLGAHDTWPDRWWTAAALVEAAFAEAGSS